ncbi:uncharacterized protein LOC105432419 [Pogonomyrmex barbatus]|uniref:Uncharacterized protein LOC105432419 n=1 Tax=Pogonomyrmex barbatus TaxID=144034 RepID=A0A6I9WPE6_9HYME|nr:uncharacterized protein LOC105432419 [Pogonomyrmex barbatus]
MRKILLVTTLLSIAMSEDILMETHPRLKTTWIRKQLWNRKTKRQQQKDISSEVEEFLNYNDRQFPRLSDTRFISESRKLPTMTLIRQHDLVRFPQVNLLSSGKPNLELSAKPRVLISIGIQEEKNVVDLQEDCSSRKSYCKFNQGWQVQQPFYVEEPRWVDIDVDYIDNSQHADGDPYILTRGKKIIRIKNPEQVDKTIEDYEATFDYPSKSKGLKSRVRRSIKMNKRSQNKITDERNNQVEQRNRYNSLEDTDKDRNNTIIIKIENTDKKSSKMDKILEETGDIFIEKYKRVNQNMTKRSLHEYKFTEQNKKSANDLITDFVEEKRKIQNKESNAIENDNSKTAEVNQIKKFNKNDGKSHFTININKRNKRSVLLKNQKLSESHNKQVYEIDVNSKSDGERNEIDTYRQVENKAYINKLNDLDTFNNLLSRNKDLFNNESSNKKDVDHNTKSIERVWELQHYPHKRLEDEETKNEKNKSEINKDDVEMTDLQSTNESGSKSFETNSRDKRNACRGFICKIEPQIQEDKWLKNIEKEIQDSLSFKRRDKHNDILDNLNLDELYIISRGKKSLYDFGKDGLPSMSRNTNNVDRAKVMIPMGLLKLLLMEMSKCNDDNCVKANRLPLRDRRGSSLDEIFAAYDPYYLVRGKRMNRNQKGTSLEMDAKQ